MPWSSSTFFGITRTTTLTYAATPGVRCVTLVTGERATARTRVPSRRQPSRGLPSDARVLLLVGEAEGKKVEVLKRNGEAINPGNYATMPLFRGPSPCITKRRT